MFTIKAATLLDKGGKSKNFLLNYLPIPTCNIFFSHYKTHNCQILAPACGALVTPKILILTYQQQTAFENIVGKEEIARNEQFLLFPQCFLLNQKIVSPFVNICDILSLFAAELEEPRIGMWDKGLRIKKNLDIALTLFHTILNFKTQEKGSC